MKLSKVYTGLYSLIFFYFFMLFRGAYTIADISALIIVFNDC